MKYVIHDASMRVSMELELMTPPVFYSSIVQP